MGMGGGGREAEAVVVKGGRKWRVHLDGEISLEEVQGAVRSLKNGKSGGIDGVLAEIVKYGGEWMVKSIWMLCVMAWKEEGVPPEWLKAIKVPIKKEGEGRRLSTLSGCYTTKCGWENLCSRARSKN